MKKVRISLNIRDYEKLMQLLDIDKRGKILKEKIEKSVEEYRQNLKKNSIKASERKIEIVKEKITNAIKKLKKEGRDINPYSVSQTAKISYLTARKYKELINRLKL